ncbi:transporter substrate-binding domain-containing protein [Methylobacterium nonmethylotrophicum]|uniref:ABC transporter substrate-binding protein n=1 Tax=Methylobacterium nonmethylotrophicum TaxID=1141884 RepID=A0A4Z0NYH1_9HYPH|nr:transporter substrate-binding domain-containing protein [Methylobacterium nonmethylotrophicum]TGE01776.1 ABC transporter substrate-binding protein [Methylobacterium nonmethylotrophicum]
MVKRCGRARATSKDAGLSQTMQTRQKSGVPRGRRSVFVAALAVALLGPARATEPRGGTQPDTQTSQQITRQIIWPVYDAAPFMMTEGEDRDAGIFDRIRRLLSARLTGYAHSTLTVPFPRIVTSLRNGEEWCFVGGVKTPEREGFAVFSRPVAMFYPLRIVIRADRRGLFAALEPLSLRGLLTERRDLRTSMLRNRAMAPAVDALLRQHPPGQSHSEFGEAFRMLLNDRLDYLVEFSSIAAYNARLLGKPQAFLGLPFAESPEPVFARVMCAGTPWGREVVARIDAVLAAERPSPDYRRIVEAWAAEEDLPRIRAVYDAFLASD